MENDDQFISAILASLWDQTLRSVYADWLEERSDPRAAFLRLDAQLFRLAAQGVWDEPAYRRRQELAADIDPGWLGAVTAGWAARPWVLPLYELREVLPPPSDPTGVPVDGGKFERGLGITFPTHFKDLQRHFKDHLPDTLRPVLDPVPRQRG